MASILASSRRRVLTRFPVVFPTIAAAVVSIFCIACLIGWHFRIAALREPFGGSMAPNSALCFILISVSLVLHRWKEQRWIHVVGISLAALVGLFSAVVLYEIVTGVNTGLVQIFFHYRLSEWNGLANSGRMQPNTAINFLLIGAALVLSYRGLRKDLAQFMTGLALLQAILAVIDYSYGVQFLYNLDIRNFMSLIAAACFVVLCVGVLLAVAPDGWVAIVLRDDPAGLLSRRVLFVTYTTIPLIGYIAIAYERNRWISSTFGTALIVVAGLFIITSTLVRSAREIRRLDNERIAAENLLREAEKLAVTGRLAASLAHEVNNPLEAVTNILYLLGNEQGLSSSSREFLTMAEEELSRVTHITRQTLAFYREPASPVPVHLADLVQQIIRVFKPKFDYKKVTVQFSSTIHGEFVIQPTEFKQIVTNLIANAIDAVGRGGNISIRLRPSRSWNDLNETGIRITVADNGIGITRGDRKRLFQPFFTTKGQKGTGLGLWVTQGLVTKHGGRMKLCSSTRFPYRGTTFSIFFPATTHPSEPQTDRRPAEFRSAV